MRSPKTLTVEVANQFLEAPEDVSLQEYEVIEDAAAEALAKYNSSLYLDGLTSLSCSAANALVHHKGGYLSLNGITSLSEMSVGALGALLKYDGVIMLGGVQYLSEEAVGILAMHKGPLHLEGLTLFPDRPVDLTTLREPPPASMPKDRQESQDKHYGLGNGHETVDEFVLPPLDLLEQPTEPTAQSIVDDLKASAKVLQETVREFGIEVESGDITKGPTVTLFELHPLPGVRQENIAALSNNIAMAMRADKIRILTPVPGKGTVGVEVPNRLCTMVYLRDMLASDEWRNHVGKFPIMLGRDVRGQPIIDDLATMPHLLIASESGPSKSVCVNAILASLLYRYTPTDLRLILIDPQMMEMQHYKNLPHLLAPVVTDLKKTPLVLGWVIREMERRFQVFAKTGVRNITGFNSETQESDKLPFIVVIVDELADLMITIGKDVEMAIQRLTQLGRSVGIHLVVATQRPNVNVVTGVIKANIPARIAFHVASMQDSRVILDSPTVRLTGAAEYSAEIGN